MSRIGLCAIVATSLAVIVLNEAHAQPINARYNERGLSAIVIGNTEIPAEAVPSVSRVRVTDEYRDKRAESRAALMLQGPEGAQYIDIRTFENASNRMEEQSYDAAARKLIQTYQWGTVQVEYGTTNNRLNLTITVANTSDKVIESVEMDIFKIKLPGEVEHDERGHHNIGQPTVLGATFENGRLVLVNEDVTTPLHLQLRTRDGDLTARLRAGNPDGGDEVYDGVWNVRPIDRGQTDAYKLSLRFDVAEANKIEMGRDIYDRFREHFPRVLNWNDRRPIGSLFFAGYQNQTPQNPRRWVNGYPNNLDVNTEEGRERLREALIRYADRVIANAHRMGIQGVIVWDMEGTEYPHPTTYIGEPRILGLIAPEMDAVVDYFFQRLNEAGVRHGMCIRPTLIWPQDSENNRIDDWSARHTVRHRPWMHRTVFEQVYAGLEGFTEDEMESPLTRLHNKIKYAKERWGSTIFYVDTPHLWRPRDRNEGIGGWSSKLLGAEVFEELARRHPDIVLIPEHQYPQYWGYTAPFHQINYTPWVTRPEIRAMYPEGWVAQFMANAAKVVDENVDAFLKGVVEGDTFLVHGHGTGQLGQVQAVFGKAVETAALKITMMENGSIVLNGNEIQNVEALRQTLGRLNRNLPLPQRRAFITHPASVSRLQVNEVVDAVIEAGGVVTWTQPQQN